MKRQIRNREYAFFEEFEKFIRESRTGRRLQPNGKRISAGTITNYVYTLKLIKRFCEQKEFNLRIRSVKKLGSRDLRQEKNYWKRFYREFTNYLYEECGHFDNYTGQVIKNIRVFFNYLNKEGVIGPGDFHKQFYVRKEEIAIFPLLPEELRYLIYDRAFEESLQPRMREVKDFFVFGCTVALRFSDLIALSKNNIRQAGDQYYLVVKSIKTSTDTLMKLPPYAVAIIHKYTRYKKRLLPAFNIVNINTFIKRLLEKAGLTQQVQLTRSKRGKPIVVNDGQGGSRFCDVASSHTMRRTAITNMLSLGVPEQIVRKISGHAPNSKEFYRYVHWSQTYQDQETEKMFKRLEERVWQSA